MRFSTVLTLAVVAISGAMPTLALDARAPTLSDVLVQALKRELDERRYLFDPSRLHIGTTVLPNVRSLEERMVFDPSRFRIGTVIPGYHPHIPMGAVARDDQPQPTVPTPGDVPPPRPFGHRGGHFGGFASGGAGASQATTGAGNFSPGGGLDNGSGGRPHHHHHFGGYRQGPAGGAVATPGDASAQPTTGQNQQAAGAQQPTVQPAQQPAQPPNARSWASRRASTIHSVNGSPYNSGKHRFILP